MSEFESVIKDFLVESHENVEQLDRDLVALEKAPGDRTILGRIFRTLHTIKGSCAFLGFRKLHAVAHAGESFLGKLRDGTRVVTEQTISVLLAAVDAIREMLAGIEVHGNDGNREHTDLIQMLGLLADGKNPTETTPTSDPSPSSAPPLTEEFSSVAGAGFLPSGTVGAPPLRSARQSGHSAAPVHSPTSETFVLAKDQMLHEESDCSVILNTPGVTIDLNDELNKAGNPMAARPSLPVSRPQAASPPAVAPAPPATPQAAEPGGPESAPALASVFDNTVRLDVQLLDKLMLLVSELVLARNQIAQCVSTLDSSQPGGSGLVAAGRQLNLITSELQEQVMKTRVQPIANIWSRFPRLVRDLAVQCGKQVEIEMEGSETELDKTIIESIRDPLTHMVRNSVDHGIESPAIRKAAGKPATGRLWLRAFHEAGQVNIEISDDGAGIDSQKVKQQAIARGIISPQQAAALGDQTLLDVLFIPGFSTAADITSVSGRGVGMDVVKTNIERIGGTVDIQSRLGHGTTIKLRIPLTLAIIKALIVTTAGQRYAIPQVSIVELVRLAGDKTRKAIERFQDAMVFRFRDRLLPVADLNRLLDVETSVRSHETNGMNSVLRGDAVNLVILQAGDKYFALVVDHVNDTQEIVVKPLWNRLKGITCLAGATIMADGRVALILDVFGLAQQAGVVARVREREQAEMKATETAAAERRHGFVLVEDSARSRMAIPLDKVARLEKFSASAIERLGDQSVVQYRGEVLPLLDVANLLRTSAKDAATPCGGSSDVLHVVVYSHGGRSIGLVVNHILDIAEQVLAVKSRATRDNVLFSTVIQGHATEFLDVEGLIRAGDPGFFAGTAGVPAGV